MILPKLGLSRKKHLPILWLFDHTYLPHEALKLMWSLRNFRIIEETSEDILLKCGKFFLRAPRYYANTLREWPIWEKHYLPNFPLHGKAVLDVGAGAGETALLYFLHGAESVVCVEPNNSAVPYLSENILINEWKALIIQEPFCLKHLKIPHDFMKMDIEGAEDMLLNANYDKPCVIEVHNRDILKQFLNNGFKVVHSTSPDQCLIARKRS